MASASPLRLLLLSVLASLAYNIFAPSWLTFSRDKASSSLKAGPNAKRVYDSIAVNGSLPTLSKHATDLSRAFEHALQTVLREATEEVDRQLDPELSRRMRGVPGTAITTDKEAERLQAYLDCTAGQGNWVRDELGAAVGRAVGGVTVHKQSSVFSTCDKRFSREPSNSSDWHVRDDLKWTWRASPTCDSLLPAEMLRTWQARPEQFADLPSRRSLCQLLRHKNILLVGDATSHYLVHDLLLDWTSDKPLTCYGDLFCNEHGICGGHLAEGAEGHDDWNRDETVNEHLPAPPGPKSDKLLLPGTKTGTAVRPGETYGTILRYRRSDGFYLRTSPSMPGHEAHFLHPATNVREINNYALADARRSDIVLINKAPLPMPLSSAYFGNWTMKLETASLKERPVLALKLALAMTLDTWLIDLLDSLTELRDYPSPESQLIVYRSAWRSLAHCGNEALSWSGSPVALEELVQAMNHDLHLMIHDFQVVLQNHLLRHIVLPRYGIPILDLETPLSVWQSGFVGGKSPKNCLQPCIPSAGMALERAMIGGLWKVMAWGWAKDADSVAEWTGDGYVPVRVRHPMKSVLRRRH